MHLLSQVGHFQVTRGQTNISHTTYVLALGAALAFGVALASGGL
jgi:hypothetical protein